MSERLKKNRFKRFCKLFKGFESLRIQIRTSNSLVLQWDLTMRLSFTSYARHVIRASPGHRRSLTVTCSRTNRKTHTKRRTHLHCYPERWSDWKSVKRQVESQSSWKFLAWKHKSLVIWVKQLVANWTPLNKGLSIDGAHKRMQKKIWTKNEKKRHSAANASGRLTSTHKISEAAELCNCRHCLRACTILPVGPLSCSRLLTREDHWAVRDSTATLSCVFWASFWSTI